MGTKLWELSYENKVMGIKLWDEKLWDEKLFDEKL